MENDCVLAGDNERDFEALASEQRGRSRHSGAAGNGTDRLSYRELDERANRLANLLGKNGVGPEVPVGICTERSVELVVGLLGILKAGGFYLPLDPGFPTERLAYMISDAG